MTNREAHIHTARVMLDEAKRRRHDRVFALCLLRWAANQRRLAMACVRQPDLFE